LTPRSSSWWSIRCRRREDIIVRERVRTRRSVVLLVDVSGSMRGERVRTAAVTVGALAAELERDDLAVVAFWSDAAVLSHLGQHVPPQRLLDTMLAIPAKGLTNIAFPLQVAARELARELARLGHGRLRRIRTYTDIAPALSAIFAS
jgi:uncharacterized protein with von Willebrand factor type A (vWA) domain